MGACNCKSGFTLIEMSIVLVIIGLIVGGILVGRDLISAAQVRATIAQVEKFQTAKNAFLSKYGYLPGDIRDPDASNFGFEPRGQYAGEGDGNGVIDGLHSDAAGENGPLYQTAGEVVMFWVDLSAAHMIEGSFTIASSITEIWNAQGSTVGQYLPSAKIGRGNYFNIWNGGIKARCCQGAWPGDGNNYFGLSAASEIGGSICGWALWSAPGLTVGEAYAIDSKIDDGFPQSGRVMAMYVNYNIEPFAQSWAAGGAAEGAMNGHLPSTAGTPGSSSTCYDNGNVTGAAQQYSIAQNNGTGVNCALSFKFQ